MSTLKSLAVAAGVSLAAALASPAANASVATPAPLAQTSVFSGAAPAAEQVKWGHRGFRRGHGVKRYGVTGFRRQGFGRFGHGKYGHRKYGKGLKKGFFLGLPFFKKGVVVKK